MTETHNFIEIVTKLGQKQYKLCKVYRRMQDRELFLIAYGKLYSNKGATTAGVDPDDTVEGMSLKRIGGIIEKLHTGKYQWQPVRRIEIDKKNGGKRPLGLPGWNDKMVQEVMRMILEAYYEPQFSEHSHGFRPQKGCHTALAEIKQKWTGTKWFIEGDIKGCFDNIDHDTLLNIIGRDIKDDRFLKLLKEMLKAGYLQDWKYHQTYSGVPQGGVISPILSNIFLNELDKSVEQELIPAHTRGDKRETNQEYRKISNTMHNMTRRKNWDRAEYKKLDKIRKQTPSVETHDPEFRRLHYVRYADDFLLGFTGPKAEAEEIREKIKQFLGTMNLTLSTEKTLITHATTQKARFLGYEIHTAQEDAKWSKKTAKMRKRSINGQIILKVPDEVERDWQKKYSKAGKPNARARLIECSDYEIIQTYGIELRGLVNYYQLATNVSKKLYPVKYWMEQSLVKTLAAKHKQKVPWVYRNYKVKTEQGLGAIRVVVPNPNHPEKPWIAQFAGISIKTRPYASITDDIKTRYHGRNELVGRLLANECELCDSDQDIRVHHLHQLKDLKKKYAGRTEPPPWAAFMIERNRKTIVVCQECHRKIHKGEYDGKKVT